MLGREESDSELLSTHCNAMDLYLPSMDAGLSLQEMIESDMKFDGLDPGSLDSPDGLPCFNFDWDLDKPFNNFESMSDMDLFGSFGAPNPHKPSIKAQESEPESEHGDAVGSWMNISAMSSYNIDENGGPAINPSHVLPTKAAHQKVNNTAIVMNSSANFRTGAITNTTKETPISSQIKVSDLMNGKVYATQGTNTGRHEMPPPDRISSLSNTTMVTSSTLTTPSVQPFIQHQTVTTTTQPPKHLTYIKGQVNRSGPIFSASKQERLNRMKNAKQRRQISTDEKVFPKPAYSYSCLIALALKNSATGSLPVSEIYSFMCEHFPYFRTAPSGWKNSVRHNLSLNKCFEKIEKPVVSGNNQRKGCLWALNPTKLSKMDEEVQKWNKKGLKDIQEAMSYPEVLESLERGEMKFDPLSGTSCSEDEEEEEEEMKIKQEPGTNGLTNIKILNPMTTPMVVPASHKTIGRPYGSNVKTFAQIPTTAVVSLAQRVQRNGNNVIQIRSSPVADRDGADYKPDSTMAEINIQSFGGGFDEEGELSLEGNLGLANGKDSSTSFVVKKITTNNTSNNLSALVYSSQAVQKHSLNRVLLTNSK